MPSIFFECMNLGINYIRDGVKKILFPHVCVIYGHHLPKTYSFVCESCLNNRFEEVEEGNQRIEPNIILPEGIEFKYSMWRFDKGGFLQDLLHNLKYHQMEGVGIDLGRQLGKQIISKTSLQKHSKIMIIPVPLHKKKEKKRGFNQARILSVGIRDTTDFKLVNKGIVLRVKNTKTQTGFTLKKRNENLQNAFYVEKPEKVKNQECLIVDDVYTTGSTTFELAKALRLAGAKKIFIATVACA